MHKSPLGIHEIKLVVKPPPGLGNGCGVGEHADSPLHLSQVPTRHHGGWLVVYPNSWVTFHHLVSRLETSIGNLGYRELLVISL